MRMELKSSLRKTRKSNAGGALSSLEVWLTMMAGLLSSSLCGLLLPVAGGSGWLELVAEEEEWVACYEVFYFSTGI